MSLILSGTDGLSDIDGSAATPAIRGTDANTGIFFPAADTIAFSEGGVEAARFDSAGNLLVGTSTTGSAGINLSSTYNIGWGQSAGESIPNIFRQTSSAATVLTNGYRYSATANGFASSYSSSWAKSAIALNEGSVRFYTDTAVTTAAGTDVTPTERMRIDSSGNLLFNSGYGSVATAYGCRAWVNFNGTGTPAIRASGNVTSITDNGTGDYTVNFTTAMPDANYLTVCTGSVINDQGSTYGFGTRTTAAGSSATLKSTTQYRVLCRQSSDFDLAESNVAIFR